MQNIKISFTEDSLKWLAYLLIESVQSVKKLLRERTTEVENVVAMHQQEYEDAVRQLYGVKEVAKSVLKGKQVNTHLKEIYTALRDDAEWGLETLNTDDTSYSLKEEPSSQKEDEQRPKNDRSSQEIKQPDITLNQTEIELLISGIDLFTNAFYEWASDQGHTKTKLKSTVLVATNQEKAEEIVTTKKAISEVLEKLYLLADDRNKVKAKELFLGLNEKVRVLGIENEEE